MSDEPAGTTFLAAPLVEGTSKVNCTYMYLSSSIFDVDFSFSMLNLRIARFKPAPVARWSGFKICSSCLFLM